MAKLITLKGWAQVPNEVLCDSQLSFKAKGIFAYMQSKPHDWDFSCHRIINETADGRDSVTSGLSELEEKGYLERRKRKNPMGQWEYEHVLVIPNAEKPCQGIADQGIADQGIADQEKPANKKEIYTKKYIQRNNIKKEDSTQLSTFADFPNNEPNQVDQLFQVFWKAYPIKKSKGLAQKSWAKILKAEGLDVSAEIISSVERHKTSEAQWLKNNGEFIPHPSTFLNQARWRDEIVTKNSGGTRSFDVIPGKYDSFDGRSIQV
jgi:hypothetical protein